MKADKVTPLTPERNVNLKKDRTLHKHSCGYKSEDSGSSAHISLEYLGGWVAFSVSQRRD